MIPLKNIMLHLPALARSIWFCWPFEYILFKLTVIYTLPLMQPGENTPVNDSNPEMACQL